MEYLLREQRLSYQSWPALLIRMIMRVSNTEYTEITVG